MRPHTHTHGCTADPQTHPLQFCTQRRMFCTHAVQRIEFSILSWLVRLHRSFSDYGTFTKTAGGQRPHKRSPSASPAEARCPQHHAQQWTLFVGRLVGAERRWLRAVCGSCTYCRCLYHTRSHTKSECIPV